MALKLQALLGNRILKHLEKNGTRPSRVFEE